MYHKKLFSTVFTAAVFFSLISLPLSATAGISSLKLDFERTEKSLQQEESNYLSGSIIYNQNPFVFVFQIKAPLVQTLLLTREEAYIIEPDHIHRTNENYDFLKQTCIDFLNWFKNDYGLTDSFFKTSYRWLEEEQIVSQWDCSNFENQPLDKVLVWSDSQGHFTRLKMFVNTNTLVTDTRLSAFLSSAGFTYPSLIESTSYHEDKPFIQTELKLSNVSFALCQEDFERLNKITDNLKPLSLQYQKEDLSSCTEFLTPDIPQTPVYKSTFPSIIAGAGFKFYKAFITEQDMSNCPFYPSCSQYMLEAINANGIAGFIQGLERLKRCTNTEHKRDQYPTLENGKHYDPVPVKKPKSKKSE